MVSISSKVAAFMGTHIRLKTLVIRNLNDMAMTMARANNSHEYENFLTLKYADNLDARKYKHKKVMMFMPSGLALMTSANIPNKNAVIPLNASERCELQKYMPV